MDNLTTRLADLFRHYQVDFRRMAHVSEAENEQATDPYRREIAALIAEHGREAVVRATLVLPVGLPTLN